MNRFESVPSCGQLILSEIIRKPALIPVITLLCIFLAGLFPRCACSKESRSGFFVAELAKNSPSNEIAPLQWLNDLSQNSPRFYYPNPMRPYMRRLGETYKLKEMTADARSDIERIRIVTGWVHEQWQHHGDCPKQNNDPIAILEAARNGSTFSCYEYSLVTSGCLNAIGIRSRIVVLLPKDVEQRPAGNYHVVAEAFLNDRKKWVMVDAQWNVVPTLNNYPLCVVELQHLLAKRAGGIEYGELDNQMYVEYPRSLLIYIHHLYTPLDNRVIGATAPMNIEGGVMLLPKGTKPPHYFAEAPVGKFSVTNSIADFYGTEKP